MADKDLFAPPSRRVPYPTNSHQRPTLIKNMREGARKFGKPLDSVSHRKEKMEDACFVDV